MNRSDDSSGSHRVRWPVILLALSVLVLSAALILGRDRGGEVSAPGVADRDDGVRSAPSRDPGEPADASPPPVDATVAVDPGADASMSSAAFDELDPGEQEQVARRAFGELARSLSDVKAPDLLGEQPRVIDATPDR